MNRATRLISKRRLFKATFFQRRLPKTTFFRPYLLMNATNFRSPKIFTLLKVSKYFRWFSYYINFHKEKFKKIILVLYKYEHMFRNVTFCQIVLVWGTNIIYMNCEPSFSAKRHVPNRKVLTSQKRKKALTTWLSSYAFGSYRCKNCQ